MRPPESWGPVQWAILAILVAAVGFVIAGVYHDWAHDYPGASTDNPGVRR